MTTNTFDPSVVDNVDQSTVETNDVQFPLIQWHYGDPKAKKYGGMDFHGGFFMPESMAPASADLEGAGWEKTTWTHNDGSETEGYTVRELTMAVVRERRRWEVYEGSRRLTYAWQDYDKTDRRGKGRNHVLVVLKNLEEAGPFVMTLGGMSGMYFNGTRNVRGVLTEFDRTVMRAANDAVKAAGKKGLMPRRAFWLTMGAARDGKGQPVFTTVGQGNDTSNLVMPVALGLPDKPEGVELSEWFVGRDLLARLSEIYTEADEWATAWDDIEPGTSDQRETEEDAAVENPTEDVAEELGL